MSIKFLTSRGTVVIEDVNENGRFDRGTDTISDLGSGESISRSDPRMTEIEELLGRPLRRASSLFNASVFFNAIRGAEEALSRGDAVTAAEMVRSVVSVAYDNPLAQSRARELYERILESPRPALETNIRDGIILARVGEINRFCDNMRFLTDWTGRDDGDEWGPYRDEIFREAHRIGCEREYDETYRFFGRLYDLSVAVGVSEEVRNTIRATRDELRATESDRATMDFE